MPSVSPTVITSVSATTDGMALQFNYDLGDQALNAITVHVPPVAVEAMTISLIDGPSGNAIISPTSVHFIGLTVTVTGNGYSMAQGGAFPLMPKGTFYSGNRFVEIVLET